MRIILYTGKGGVGKTSISAATALQSAKQGLKTLVMSTDPAHSLGDSFGIKLSSEPKELRENLWAQEINTIYEMEKGWGKLQKYITLLFTSKAADDITTEELTMFPGMEDLISLLRVLDYYKQNTYDVIIIDCAPTGETLAMLSFPDMLGWWMEKLFPIKRKVLKVVRPVAQPLLGVPLPTDDIMDELTNTLEQLGEMRDILSNREVTSIRVVVNPEKMVIKEAQRSFTYLNLYDYNVDAIMINRVIPNTVTDSYFQAWKDAQKKYKALIQDSFQPLPIYEAPMFEQEVVGLPMLERVGDTLFKDDVEPTAVKFNGRTQYVKKDGDEYIFVLSIPFSDKNDLSLNQKGDELIIRAGSVKRNITLPKTLTHLSVQGAKFEGDVLNIRFGGVVHA
ncbi:MULTISPECIES: ArsA family ATPase [Bacillus cereus group]|uniref:arsenite-transporting ATPase n=1 Tax=Bacillus cereus TaxID=1396 RepID=A0AA44TH00_BACCE|nr:MULTISPECIES: ArsA family ATPase [Bacillus cereus group]EEL52385.1 Anion-transporting ATPase [Bacillus cereus Rock3-44]PFA17392.1 arsenic-transporting ATPase [Bacillus cereus]PFN08647.1 arsenic-transporting ATPase [Bacillus cereus]PFO82341.1 arsenic-transporting ATPase [Bacillus cereus]PFR27312.1 arsenic-transporting ATPase [Bacillus cereus]